MIGSQPGVALDRLTDALEAEILAASESEVHAVMQEVVPAFGVEALRAFVARAVEGAERIATIPPPSQGGPALRR